MQIIEFEPHRKTNVDSWPRSFPAGCSGEFRPIVPGRDWSARRPEKKSRARSKRPWPRQPFALGRRDFSVVRGFRRQNPGREGAVEPFTVTYQDLGRGLRGRFSPGRGGGKTTGFCLEPNLAIAAQAGRPCLTIQAKTSIMAPKEKKQNIGPILTQKRDDLLRYNRRKQPHGQQAHDTRNHCGHVCDWAPLRSGHGI